MASRKKKTAASEAGTAATTDVVDVVEKEVLSKGTLGITQESEAVVDKGVPKPKPKRLRKKGVISPAVGDNLMEIKEVAEEQAEEGGTLQVRCRRQLPKAMSSPRAKSPGPSKKLRKAKSPTEDVLPPASEVVGEDEEKKEVRFLIGKSSPTAKELEKEIDRILAQAIQHPFISESLITLDDLVQEHMEENPSDQSGGSNVDASDEKEDEEVTEDEDEDVGQREGKGVAMEDEEEEEEAEEEEEGDEEEMESEEDEARRPSSRKFHQGVLSRRKLTMPHKRMMKRYADVLLGPSSRGARMALDSIPRTHELALVMRNIAELSALSGHSLRRSLTMDSIQKRYRKRTRMLQAEVK
ncbi:hypothetical protein Dimus_032124 [Dionaea muscipula]